MLKTISGNAEKKDYDDDKIHSVKIMGNVLESMSQEVKHNDMKAFKEYLDKHKNIRNFTSDIQYGYQVTLNLYKDDDTVTRVNPTTVLDTVGLNSSGSSSIYNGFLSNYDVFYELMDNEKLLKQEYNLVAGKWPENYNEVVLTLGENNEISDYTLYSLGILSQEDLKEQFNKMINGDKAQFEDHSYTKEELLSLKFRLLLKRRSKIKSY